MIIVRLKGGLGNQLFQYAAGRRLAEVNAAELKLDLGFLERGQRGSTVTVREYELAALNCQQTFATLRDVRRLRNLSTRVFGKILPGVDSNPYCQEKYFHFDPKILTLSGDRYLEGHWMSEKYFADIAPLIRKEFTFRKGVLDQGKKLQEQILASHSICIQVRRGDYVTNPEIAKIHQTTSLSYFEQGIAHMRTVVERPEFFVFSDDSEWCETELKGLENVHFVEKELAGTGAVNSDYLQLMISCKHFIISNSTFAWWGAWLSNHRDKTVVAPQHWFNDRSILTNDIYPDSWIKL